MISLLLALCSFQEPNYTDSVKKYKDLYNKTCDSMLYYSNILVQISDRKMHAMYRKLEEKCVDKSTEYFNKYFDFIEKEETQKKEKQEKKYRQT